MPNWNRLSPFHRSESDMQRDQDTIKKFIAPPPPPRPPGLKSRNSEDIRRVIDNIQQALYSLDTPYAEELLRESIELLSNLL